MKTSPNIDQIMAVRSERTSREVVVASIDALAAAMECCWPELSPTGKTCWIRAAHELSIVRVRLAGKKFTKGK